VRVTTAGAPATCFGRITPLATLTVASERNGNKLQEFTVECFDAKRNLSCNHRTSNCQF